MSSKSPRAWVLGAALLFPSACLGTIGDDGDSDGPGSDVPCDSSLLSWDAPTAHTDGSCAAEDEVKGYNVYFGARAGAYTELVSVPLDDPGLSCVPNDLDAGCGPGRTCTYEIKDLPAASWYFAVTAVGSQANETGYSNEGSKTITCGEPLPACPDEGSTLTNHVAFYADGEPPQWMYDGYSYRADGSAKYVLVVTAAGNWEPGTYPLTVAEESAETCQLCIKIFRGKVVYMPRAGGTVTLTAVDPARGGRFAGSLSDVVLREVTIDPSSNVTTPVEGGLQECLTAYSWDVVMEME